MQVRLDLAEQDDPAHLRLLVHNSEERVQTVAGLHRVDVVLLLHDQFNALVSGSTHHVSTGVRRHRVATRKDLDSVLLPEAVDGSRGCVEPHDGAVSGLRVDNAVLVLSASRRSDLVGDDTGTDHHLGAVGDADDAERLQLTSVTLGDVMHSVDASDSERVTGLHVGRLRHGHRLVTVIHVETLCRGGRGGHCAGDLVVVRGVASVDRDRSTGSHTATVRVVELVGAEAGDLADEGAVVSGQRLALKRLTTSEVIRHAVVVASGQCQVTIKVVYTLLVEDGLALGDVIEAGGSSETLHNQRSLSGSHIENRNIDVARQLLLGGITKALFLKGVTQFSCRHDPRNRLVVADCGRDGELGVVREVRSHVSARKRAADVRLRPPDRVVGAFHHRLIRVVDRDVTGQDEGVLEPFEEVFERYAFFFAE